MSIPRSEQETTITYIRTEGVAYLSTSDDSIQRKWLKQGYTLVTHRDREGQPIRWTTKVASKLIKFGKANAKPRPAPKGGFKKRAPAVQLP